MMTASPQRGSHVHDPPPPPPRRVQLYEQFVATFEPKLNQLQLVLFAARVAGQFAPSRPHVVDGASCRAGASAPSLTAGAWPAAGVHPRAAHHTDAFTRRSRCTPPPPPPPPPPPSPRIAARSRRGGPRRGVPVALPGEARAHRRRGVRGGHVRGALRQAAESGSARGCTRRARGAAGCRQGRARGGQGAARGAARGRGPGRHGHVPPHRVRVPQAARPRGRVLLVRAAVAGARVPRRAAARRARGAGGGRGARGARGRGHLQLWGGCVGGGLGGAGGERGGRWLNNGPSCVGSGACQ